MLYSAKHDCVVYQPREPARVLACLPDARQAGINVAVPLTLRNMLVAKQIGLPAFSPIEKHYDWPGRHKPYAHQRQMAGFMTMNPRSFNLADMGTGKTLATLWAADYLMQLGYIKKALVLSPLSTLNRVWMDEIFTHFLGRRTGVLLYGDRKQRLVALSERHDFYIVNHDGFGVGTARRAGRGLELGDLADRIADDPDIGLVIVDEASAYKNPTTRRWKILSAALKDKPYVWLLSGTPTPNEPTDAWGLRKLIDPRIESYISFKDRTMFRLSQFKWLPRKDAHTTVSTFLQPAIRFAREDCLDLPPVTIETREVALSPRQKDSYLAMKKDLQMTVRAGVPITAVNEAALRMKLIQISCGAVYDAQHVAHLTEAGPRIAALSEVVEQAGAKCLIFAPLTAVVKLIYAELVRQGWSCAMVTGDVSQKARSAIFMAFQNEVSPRIIVADPGTMAHGLTLTAADTVIWYGPTDRPELYEQANARINRPGQVRKMLIVRLAATRIEREIYARLHEKRTLQGLVLDLVRGE